MLYDLRDDQWELIKDSLPGKAGDRGCAGNDNRGFIRAVMWVARTGAPWRALPAEYGKWSTVHKRFMRWAKALLPYIFIFIDFGLGQRMVFRILQARFWYLLAVIFPSWKTLLKGLYIFVIFF